MVLLFAVKTKNTPVDVGAGDVSFSELNFTTVYIRQHPTIEGGGRWGTQQICEQTYFTTTKKNKLRNASYLFTENFKQIVKFVKVAV